MKAARKQPLSKYKIPDAVFDKAEKVRGVKFQDWARFGVRMSAAHYVDSDEHPPELLDIKNAKEIFQEIVDTFTAAARALRKFEDAPFEARTFSPDPVFRLRLEAKAAMALDTLQQIPRRRPGAPPNYARMTFIRNIAVNYRQAGGRVKITRVSIDAHRGEHYGPFFDFYRAVLNCLPEHFHMQDDALVKALQRLVKKDPWSSS